MPRHGWGWLWPAARQADGGYLPVEEGYRKAREAAERALALDANVAEAHEAMGWIKRAHDWDWAGADASCQRALALEPGNATVVRGAAVLAATLGRFEEALALDRRAVELDPLSVRTHNNLGLAAYYAGRLEDAVASLKKALELSPELPVAHNHFHPGEPAVALGVGPLQPLERPVGLSAEGIHLGNLEGAFRLILRDRLRQGRVRFLFTPQGMIRQHLPVQAPGSLRLPLHFGQCLLRVRLRQIDPAEEVGDPLLKSLERDPRYAAFLKKMRLPA